MIQDLISTSFIPGYGHCKRCFKGMSVPLTAIARNDTPLESWSKYKLLALCQVKRPCRLQVSCHHAILILSRVPHAKGTLSGQAAP